ncbi:MAG: alpha/beta hydrolase family protein [Candidatus Hodarchaeota archaeon]
MTDLIIENTDIPIIADKINLKASIYYTEKRSKAPFIINLAGLLDHRESYFVRYYTDKFAEVGYYVLSYDYRAHGETKKQTGHKSWYKLIVDIFEDIKVVIDWVIKNQSERLLEEKIILFGRSLGGAIILTYGFLDERAKKLITLCTRYDYYTTKVKFSEDIVKQISPKYFLKKKDNNNDRILIAHCKDDNRIPFENVYDIKNHLGLNQNNVIIFENGGHSFKGHREELFQYCLNFIKNL